MKYYKNIDTNKIYGCDSLELENTFLNSNFVEISKEELFLLNEKEINNSFNSLPYKNQRASEYPTIGDQLDALYHAGVFPEDMAAQIQAVKERYPKT